MRPYHFTSGCGDKVRAESGVAGRRPPLPGFVPGKVRNPPLIWLRASSGAGAGSRKPPPMWSRAQSSSRGAGGRPTLSRKPPPTWSRAQSSSRGSGAGSRKPPPMWSRAQSSSRGSGPYLRAARFQTSASSSSSPASAKALSEGIVGSNPIRKVGVSKRPPLALGQALSNRRVHGVLERQPPLLHALLDEHG